MPHTSNMAASAPAAPQIAITMAQEPNPAIEQSLRSVFAAAATSATQPQLIAAQVDQALGRGLATTLEAERGGWSRYRISVRVQGMPVTIATVELMLSE